MLKFEKKKPSDDEIDKMKIRDWSTWTSPAPPGFDWDYDDKEIFFILEGEAEIISGKDKISFGPGDLVTVYPETKKCRWNVKKTIKKHYKMG